jgi:hypothetical protein
MVKWMDGVKWDLDSRFLWYKNMVLKFYRHRKYFNGLLIKKIL